MSDEVARKKRSCAAAPKSNSATPIPVESPKRFEGWRLCMYTRQPPYLYPGACASGGSSPVGAYPLFSESLAAPKGAAPIGFCSGGFTSTSSLRSGQRGPTEVERRRYPEADHVLASAVAFLSARPEKGLPTISLRQAFRLQREASMAVELTACYCPRTSCHHVARRSSRWSRSP